MGLPQEEYIEQIQAENALLVGMVDATLEPSINLLNAKVIVRDMQAEIFAYESSKGVTESSKKSKQRVENLLTLLEKLDAVANQNNTYHLVVKHSLIQLHNLKVENMQLKRDIEATNQALNAE